MITSNNRTDLFYGSQRIRSRYLGDKLIWGDNLDVQSVSIDNVFIYYYERPGYAFYNYAVVQLNLKSSDAKLIQGKNIIGVELEGKTSDVKWTFPTSGSSLNKDYLAVESTAATFTQVLNKVKSDYGIHKYGTVKSVVVHYTD